MRKGALFDYAINENCYSVEWGQGFAFFFLPHRGAFGSSSFPPYTKNLPSKAQNRVKKMLMPRRGGGGGNWGGADFPDALCFLFYVNCNVVRIFFIRRFPMFNK